MKAFRPRAQLVVGILVSAVCLWVAFRRVHVAALIESLRGANYWWLLAYPILGTALNVIRAEIWRLLLGKRPPLMAAFWAYSVGFLVNNVLPFRLGEGARVTLLAFRETLPIAEVAAAAALERVLDMVSILVILALTLPFIASTAAIRRAVTGMGVMTSAIVIGLVLMTLARRGLDRFVGRAAELLARRHAGAILTRWREFSSSLAVIARPRVAVTVIASAAAVWMLTIVLQWCILRAFQPAAQLVDAAAMVGVVSIAGAVPAAPGSIGTYPWAGQQVLLVSFPDRYLPAMALAIALVSHAASYVFSTGLGAIGLAYFGVSLSHFREMTGHFEPARASGTADLPAALGPPVIHELTRD